MKEVCAQNLFTKSDKKLENNAVVFFLVIPELCKKSYHETTVVAYLLLWIIASDFT